MLTGFMLPSFGAFTMDGTIILSIGVIAVIGIVYKYKDSISFTNTDTVITEDKNSISKIEYEKNETQDNSLEVNPDKIEKTVKENEKIKMVN